VEVEVRVDVVVTPVASHLVRGASHIVVHTSPCARLFGPPMVVVTVAVAVQAMLQLLTVVRLHVEEDCVGSSVSDADSGGLESSTSFSASSNGLRSSCKPLTVFTAAVVPPITVSFTLLVVSMTQVTSEKAVLNRPPSRLRSMRILCVTRSGSLLWRRPDLHGSTPSVGFGSLANKPAA
jgi:hypothetical protein